MLTSERLKVSRLGRRSPFESGLTHRLVLDGRELEIKADSDKLSPKLIENFLQLFTLQLELNPEMKRFEGSTSLNGHAISLSLDKPSSKDLSYLKKFLNGFIKRIEL